MKKQNIIMAFDTETSNNSYILKRGEDDFVKENVKINPYLTGLYYRTHNYKEVFRYFLHPLDFIKYLCEFIDTNNCHLTLLAHNLTFDISILFPYFMTILKKGPFLYDKKKKIITGFFYYRRSRIYFEDTLRLFPNQTLRSIGKDLKMEKKEMEYIKLNVNVKNDKVYYLNKNKELKDIPLQQELDYLKRDCEIVYEAYHKFHERIEMTKETLKKAKILPYVLNKLAWEKKKYFMRKPLSVGSAGKKIFEMYLWNKYELEWDIYQPPVSQVEYNWSVKSYCGGFTSYNKDIREYIADANTRIVYYDINSSYPFQMTKKLPCGPILDKRPLTGDYVEWVEITYSKIEYKEKYNNIEQKLLPKREIGKNINSFVLYDKFFDFLKTMCKFENLKIVSVKYQMLSDKPILKEYVEGIMELKKQAKKDGNEPLVIGLKYLLNSLSGKLGEKAFEDDFELNELNQIVSKWGEEGKPNHKKNFRLVNTISFIIQNARIHLVKTIKNIVDDGGLFLYCDTDSLIVAVKKSVNMNNYMKIHNLNLGEWDKEGEFTEFYNPKCAKKYLLVNGELDEKDPRKYKFAFSQYDREMVVDSKHDKRLFTGNVLILDKKVDVWKNKKGQTVLWNTDGETASISGLKCKWKYNPETFKWYNLMKGGENENLKRPES